MGSFDDELRAVLRAQSARVAPPTDPVPAIERRARRIRQRRTIRAAVGSVLAVGLAATGVPYAVTLHGADREGKQSRIAAAAPEPRTPALEPLPARHAPDVPAAPGNQLTWPTRGYQPPEPFRRAADTWYLRHVEKRDRGTPDAARLRRHLLWSGPLPDSRWGMLEQYWVPSRGIGRWNTVLLVGRRDGSDLRAAYQRVTTFNHQRPRESASLSNNQIDRIAGYGFGFADFVLVVGSPQAEQASITLDGRKVYRQGLVEGAAVFEPVNRGPVELFQLRDGRGHLLTPNDDVGAKYDRRGAAFEGWTLDRG